MTELARVVAIACGGTGGHLFPGIAVAQELRRRGHQVHLIVSPKKIDEIALRGHDDLERTVIDVMGMPSVFSPKIVTFFRRFVSARRRCRKLLKDIGADAVLGMGGFTSLPPTLAGKNLGLSTFIHESNAVPGKANRLTARFCSEVLLGMEECSQHFPKKKTHVVGTPVRTALTENISRKEALGFFELDNKKHTLLVMGGSQGARGVNRMVGAAIDAIPPDSWQVIHIAGQDDDEKMRVRYVEKGVQAWVGSFCNRMDFALALATAAVSRSGASSLTELAWFGIPGILLPYPFAADDHQTRNAEHFTSREAAVLVQESEGESVFQGKLGKLLGDDAHRARISKNARDLSSHQSNIRICDIIENAFS